MEIGLLPVNFEDFEGLRLEKRETLCIIQQMRILHNLICVSLLCLFIYLHFEPFATILFTRVFY